MPDRDWWRVDISLSAEEVGVLRLAVPNVVPAERQWITSRPVPEGAEPDYTLQLAVFAESQEDAVATASSAYAEALHASGLPQVEPSIVGLLSPIFMEKPWARLFSEAWNLHSTGRHELAVVRAQTALEVHAEMAIAAVCRGRLGEIGGPLVAKRMPTSLRHPLKIDLLHALTGKLVSDAEWWTAYVAHVKRRNKIVHEGLSVTSAQARESLDAVQACHAWHRDVWAAA